jgi:hypothetical protein
MQFNDTTNKTGLIQLCERLTGLGDTAISGNADKLDEFTLYINKANRNIWSWIFNSFGAWQYEDSNHTDLPQATQDLVSGTDVYLLPSDAITVRGVSVQNEGGDFEKLRPITLAQIQDKGISEAEYQETDSVPNEYRLIGQTVKLYPGPSYSASNGFKVYFDRETVSFSDSDTTKVPGFVSAFHEAVAVGAARDYAMVRSLPQLGALNADWREYEEKIKSYYSQRYKELFPTRITTSRVDPMRVYT